MVAAQDHEIFKCKKTKRVTTFRGPGRAMLARKLLFRTVIIGPVCAAHLTLSTHSTASENLSAPDADVAAGKLAFNNACRTCHTTKEGDNRLGPHLYKIVGRKAVLRLFQCNEERRLRLG